MFNSTSPFCPSRTELKGSCTSSSAVDKETKDEEGKEIKMCQIDSLNPLLKKVLTHGTAEQVGEMSLKTSTFIAQAECETKDSQEFSPSCFKRAFVPSPNCFTSSPFSELNNVSKPTMAHIQEPSNSSAPTAPRRKRKDRRKRKGKKKVENKCCRQRHRHRMPSGVPEQESGRPLVQILARNPCPIESHEDELALKGRRDVSCRPSVYSQQIYDTGSSCSPLNWGDPFCPPLSSHPSYGQDSDSDSFNSGGDYSLAVAGLRGSVSQGDRCYAGAFIKDVERDVREEEDEHLTPDTVINEGIIFFNDGIHVNDSEYKAGRDYSFSRLIKEGSYGAVHHAVDTKTNFEFAVKKIPLKRFDSEEVCTWSTLKSPRVVDLFGVVREGPYVVLLMDYKYSSVGRLIEECGRLPEDLSLHYHSQVLAALEYLGKKKIAHLDIKADNVLLSEDGRDTFLCDFGHAETLDNQGQSLRESKDLKGSETHMAPEIVKGEPRGAKADVWSSCCMLLHMLNGCQPWTRYYNCRLYLKIAYEPPPLREIPSDCSPLTADIIKAGLQKDPAERASASELKGKTARALKQVGGLTSPVWGPYRKPLHFADKPPDLQFFSSLDSTDEDEDEDEDAEVHVEVHQESVENEITIEKKTKALDDDDESKRGWPFSPQMLISEPNHKRANKVTTMSELELRKLEREFYLSSLSQLHSAEMQEQLLSCISNDTYSNWDQLDKKDSGRWSLSPGDDFSSGVFSYNSQTDVQVFSIDLLNQTQPLPPCCFEGVDVSIRDFNRRTIRIRETRRVTVGHIATGISDQISQRVFTLETLPGRKVSHDEEVLVSGLVFCCVPAPDYSSAWNWRIRDGMLEKR